MVELPKVNSIVIATAKKVLEHGAYFTLDEYGSLEAYMPIGEVSSSRIVDIEDAIITLNFYETAFWSGYNFFSFLHHFTS